MLANENLDAVVVATNHASHYVLAKPCLAQGIHLLIEKPMTLYAFEAKELVALAQANRCEISIGYNANFTPYAIRAREIQESGVLGQIQYISGVFNQHNLDLLKGNVDRREYGTKVHNPGAVYSDPQLSGGGHGHLQMTHLLGLLFRLTDLRAYSVSAHMRKHGLAVDLVNAILVQFESGALAAIGGTSNMPGGRKIDLQIYCEHGWLDIDDVLGVAAIHGEKIGSEHFAPTTNKLAAADRFASTNNLIDRILGRAPNEAPGEIGWRAVEVLDAAYRSAAEAGRPVLIEELYANP
jgi:predicted dehydrogenase